MARKEPTVRRRPAAVLDLVEISVFLASRGSFEVADRFLALAEKTFELLATMPGLGTLWESSHPHLADVRFFPVTRFPNHLVFYRPRPDGIEVIRVFHGARDIAGLLEAEEEQGH